MQMEFLSIKKKSNCKLSFKKLILFLSFKLILPRYKMLKHASNGPVCFMVLFIMNIYAIFEFGKNKDNLIVSLRKISFISQGPKAKIRAAKGFSDERVTTNDLNLEE